jgi:class 3 adenylate cyclase
VPHTETVTVAFSDLVNSTGLAADLGHDAYEAVRRDHFNALRAAVAQYGGSVVKGTGDGLLLKFASAANAVSGAVAMQQATDSHARRMDGVALQIRVGMSSGEVTSDDQDLYGVAVVEASRLCAAAVPGQILACDIVRALVRTLGAHTFKPLGALTLKGLPEPVPVCEIAWEPLPQAVVLGPPPLPGSLVGEQQFSFAGRQRELDTMIAAWREALSGAPRVVLIAGEPGIGKTRLAAETARVAHAEGAIVLYGRSDEEMGVPFQPFVEALGYFVTHSPPDGLRDRLGRHAGELVRLVPELAERLHGLPSLLRSDPETERYRLFDAVTAWLVAAAAERPLVIVLDDLHWAPKPTLLMLRHVIRVATASAEPARLLMVATHRDTEVEQAHPLGEFLADLRRMVHSRRLALSGVNEAGVVAFVERALGHSADDAGIRLAHAVHAETEGNPFFVSEVLRHLVESGAAYQRGGRWASDQILAQIGIPEGVREVIGQRLARLSRAANDVLTVAAIAGRDFDLATLVAASELDEDALLAVLDDTVRARLVEETGVGSFRFAHALIRSALYNAASATRRAHLHRRIGEAIEARRPDDVTALAYHFGEAATDQLSKAVDFTMRAGDQAAAGLAHDQAVVFYLRALALVDALKKPDPAQRCELLIRLGEAQRNAGDAAYRQTLLDASALAERLPDAARLAHAVLVNSRGWVSASGLVDTERVAMLEAALDAVGTADSPVRARLLATLVSELLYFPDRERLRPLDAEALAIARRLGDPATLAHVLRQRYIAMWGLNTLAERLATTAEHLQLAALLDDPVERWWASERRAFAALEAGDIVEVDRQLTAMTQLGDELGRPGLQWEITLAQSWRDLLAGRVAAAEQSTTKAFEISQTLGQLDAVVFYGAQLWDLRRVQGRLAEVEPMIVQVLTDFPGMPAFRSVVALTYCELDRDAEARPLFADDAARRFALPRDTVWLWALTNYARVCACLQAIDAAAVLYEHLAPYHDHVVFNGGTVNGSVAGYLGLLASTLGRHEDAGAHYSEACGVHERMGAVYWLAVNRLDWASMYARRNHAGDAGHARELLAKVQEAARAHGFARVEQQAARVLLQIG